MNQPQPLLATRPVDKTAFDHQGWCLLGRILDDRDLAAVRSEEVRFRAHPMENDKDVPGSGMLFRSQVAPFSAVVRGIIAEGRHLDQLEQLLGPDLVFVYTQFVTKFPDEGKSKTVFPWHQDNGYSEVGTADNITVWVAIDDVDKVNGCVYVMPGSHLRGLLPHTRPNPESWHLDVPADGDGIPAILKAGEAVAFTGLTLHRSLLNRSGAPRRGFFMHYSTPHTRRLDGTPLWQQRYAWMVRGQLPPLPH